MEGVKTGTGQRCRRRMAQRVQRHPGQPVHRSSCQAGLRVRRQRCVAAASHPSHPPNQACAGGMHRRLQNPTLGQLLRFTRNLW